MRLGHIRAFAFWYPLMKSAILLLTEVFSTLKTIAGLIPTSLHCVIRFCAISIISWREKSILVILITTRTGMLKRVPQAERGCSGQIGPFWQCLAGDFARRLSQGYLWHSTKKFCRAGREEHSYFARKNIEGAPVISRPAIYSANSWRTITKLSRDYLPLAQWCNVDDPHMLARNITMMHGGVKKRSLVFF